MKNEPLDRLLREAAGKRSDPAPSRHAIRAVLGLKLAQRRRRDARVRVMRTTFIAALLLVVMSGQLGSDDFNITTEKIQKADKEWTVYRQGLRGEEVPITHRWTDVGLDEADVEELLQQHAADVGVIVGLTGWQVGRDSHFKFVQEFMVDGQFVAESAPVPGHEPGIPDWLKAYMGAEYRAVFKTVDETWRSRAADFTLPMYFGELKWVVQGWRILIPGKGEIIYYRGVRADGVRSKDTDDF